MCQAVCQLTVVGEQQQSLGVGIQPADVEEPLLAANQQVAHGRPTLGIGHRRHHAPGLVQRQMHGSAGRRDAQTVDPDDHLLGVHADALLPHGLAVDGDPAGSDQLFAGAARTDTCGGHDLLETDARIHLNLTSTSSLVRTHPTQAAVEPETEVPSVS